MSVDTLCNHNVATIRRDEDIASAAERMRHQHVGDLVVVEQRGVHQIPVGIITDRDIVVSIVAKGVPPSEIRGDDAMNADLLTVHKDSGVETALREMARVGVRRAPVVGDEGELVGILSIDDVLDRLATQLAHISDIVRMERRGENRAGA